MSKTEKALLATVAVLVILLGIALHLGANSRQDWMLDHCEWSTELQRMVCGK